MSDFLKQQLANVKLTNLSKRHKKNQVWPLEKKIEVVTKYLVLGHLKLVAASTGVSYGVIKQWRMEPWWKDLEAEIRATQNIALDNKLSKIIERSLEATMDRLENGEHVLNQKTGEIQRRPVAMKDAAKVANDLMARQHILRTQEASKPQESQQSVTEQLKTLAMEFAKWQSKESAKAEAIDVEVKESKDAVPEEWEEGLQTRATMGEGEQTESSEGSSGKELGPEYNGEEGSGEEERRETGGSQEAAG